jgi:hypothetical protein
MAAFTLVHARQESLCTENGGTRLADNLIKPETPATDRNEGAFESIPIHEYIVAKRVYKVGLDLELRTVSIGASQIP